jgi:hypothetical protein
LQLSPLSLLLLTLPATNMLLSDLVLVEGTQTTTDQLVAVSNHLAVPLPLVLLSLATRLCSSKLETTRAPMSTTLFPHITPRSLRTPI